MTTAQSSILVTDFDGTVTAEDFYRLAVEHFLQPQDLAPWQEFTSGRISHFEAVRQIFSRIHAPKQKVLDLLPQMQPEPRLAEYQTRLSAAGWRVIVASAGCEWYVRHILDSLGVTFEVHANPGEYPENGPLIMRAPTESPFYSPEDGVDKAAIVRHHQAAKASVAYAGDGFPDIHAALLVPPHLRFARQGSALASLLDDKNETYIPFNRWGQVAEHLLRQGGAAC